MKVDGSGQSRLTNNLRFDERPDWQPPPPAVGGVALDEGLAQLPLKVNSSDGLIRGFLLESIAVVTIIVVMLGYAFLYTRRRSRIHE